MNEYRTIIPFIKENRWRYFWGILALCIVDIASLLVPQVIKRFADLAQFNQLTKTNIFESIFWIIGLGIIVATGRYGWRINIFGTARKLEYWLRSKLFNHYLRMDDSFYTDHRTGDLMAHVSNDVLMVRNSMGGGIIMIFDALFMTFFTIFMMISTVGLKIALIALSALPFLALTVFLMAKPLRERSREVQDTFSELTNEVQENISGIHNIKAFSIENNRAKSFLKINKLYQSKNINLVKLSAAFDPLITLIAGIAFVIFIIFGLRELMTNNITIGDFVAVIQYVGIMIWPMIALGMVVNTFQRGIAGMTRINEILAIKSKINESEEPIPLNKDKIEIEFKNVSFRYSQDLPYVLKNVSFQIKDGQTFAILGATGAGKSTILNLLLRRYDVTAGNIYINNIDIRDLSFEDLYQAIALVEQESFLFSRTIAGNIAFQAQSEIELARIRRSAKFAQIDQEIMEMPEQYETWVGERGVTLSGGQKQRISIARAHYQTAKVLVLDDALSAVDTNTEHHFLNQIKDLKSTLLIVSQRISTVKDADQIIVIQEGKIIQHGNHESLLREADSFYAKLHERQLLESQLNRNNSSS
ncbi:MAG: ABC transporter ATP-binding protein [Clostridiaceae bacterium]|nr:ABC transporter ATP-binding protein [Clostridiaceae bacterium]